MFAVHIQLRIKFRAFGYTFAEFQKQWIATEQVPGFIAEEPVLVELPANAHKHLDRNGVKVFSWQ